MKPSDPRLACVGSCLITDSVSLLVIGLFGSAVPCRCSLGGVYVFRNLSISSSLSSLLACNSSLVLPVDQKLGRTLLCKHHVPLGVADRPRVLQMLRAPTLCLTGTLAQSLTR